MEKYKQIDKDIATGYSLLKSGKIDETCNIWLSTWEAIKNVMTEDQVKDIPALQQKYSWTEFIMNYVQDLDQELYNISLENPQYISKRIRYCEELLEVCGNIDELLIENTRRSLAESIYALGNKSECDRLYEQWLTQDPAWGWGYIGWADCYHFSTESIAPDHHKAAEIIDRGLGEKDLRDRIDVVDRAVEIYIALDDKQRVEELESQLSRLKTIEDNKYNTNAPFKASQKVGRNDPCPCGSGKKYKKCCGSVC